MTRNDRRVLIFKGVVCWFFFFNPREAVTRRRHWQAFPSPPVDYRVDISVALVESVDPFLLPRSPLNPGLSRVHVREDPGPDLVTVFRVVECLKARLLCYGCSVCVRFE